MPNTNPIILTNLEEALGSIPSIVDRFLEDGIAVIRGINLSDEEQIKLARAIGDEIGWVPNNSSNFNERYQESHANNTKKDTTSGDEIALEWHMEHVEYDAYAPIIAGVWNMYKFSADPETGKTYFFDASKAYLDLPEDWKLFLSKCTAVWSKLEGAGPFYTPSVQDHWKTGEKVIRIDVTSTEATSDDALYTYDGRTPTPDERKLYAKIRDHFISEIQNNTENRIVHRWNQGDLVIPDLFKMVHAVTGGFESKDREFIGYWMYPRDPESGR